MTIKAIALDDEQLSLDILQHYAKSIPFLKLQKGFKNPSLATKYLKENECDLVFLDIQMPDILGIEFYQKFASDKMLILTTAYSNYAVSSYELRTIDYLLKPFSIERFQKALQKAQEFFVYQKEKKESPLSIYVYVEYVLTKILLDEVLYVEAMGNYVKIFTSNKKFVLTNLSLKKISECLPQAQFSRIHKSYVVANKSIEKITTNGLKIKNIDTLIPLGKAYKKNILHLP